MPTRSNTKHETHQDTITMHTESGALNVEMVRGRKKEGKRCFTFRFYGGRTRPAVPGTTKRDGEPNGEPMSHDS